MSLKFELEFYKGNIIILYLFLFFNIHILITFDYSEVKSLSKNMAHKYFILKQIHFTCEYFFFEKYQEFKVKMIF